MTRWAIYHAPAVDSAWWRFGARWLGRDETTGEALAQTPPAGLDGTTFAALTAEPRRYGFHGTLKAPFRLREGASEALLRKRLAAVAATLAPVPLGMLAPRWTDGFLALVPAQAVPALDHLAAQCVTALDDLRAPLTAAERMRRQPERLDARGRALLDQLGYPHVLERFRFHMTLTGALDEAMAQRLGSHLAPTLAALHAAEAPRIDRLCLFRQADPGSPFLRVHDEVLA